MPLSGKVHLHAGAATTGDTLFGRVHVRHHRLQW